MKLKRKIKSHFKFNKQERSGIFFLLLFIVVLQSAYLGFRVLGPDSSKETFLLDEETQKQVEVLKERALASDSIVHYPFNPNNITDYKGYTLGMSVAEIDRLHDFRKRNNFINSEEDFQRVTQISDSLLDALSPYFKFPEWVGNTSKASVSDFGRKKGARFPSVPDNGVVLDLNQVIAEDLRAVHGIGEKLSVRIVKFRERLGGFLEEEQLNDVYGLDPEVVQRILKKFKILNKPDIEKININTASAAEISGLIYIQQHVAEGIVNYRNNNGTIRSFDELRVIEDFPAHKIDRIRLYLSL